MPRPATGAGAPQTGRASATPPQASSTAAGAAATEPPARPSTATALVGEAVEREIRVETADVIAVFTNRGARLKSWRLKHYFDPRNAPLELEVFTKVTFCVAKRSRMVA